MKFKSFYNLYSLQKRFVVLIVSIVMLFVVLAGRIFFLQIINGKKLQGLAADEWLRDLPLASRRGEIVDANGVSLASTITSYDVYVRARNVVDSVGLAEDLSNKLGLEYNKTYSKVTNKSFSEILIKMQVEEKTALSLTKHKGVYLSQNVKRVYPYSNLLTQVLGYCTIDNIGQAGLESYYNKFLFGVPGKSLTQTNAQGKEINNSLAYYVPSIDGATLHTNLDVQMQIILEKELQIAYEENKAQSVSGLILDATTGGIKAMSCLPSFDLNQVPRDNISKLQALTKNTTVVDVYEPGSTFKLITLAGALNEGLTNINERFYCGGRCTVDGEKIKCWKSVGHGSLTLLDAFKNSCNCVFVQLALRLGIDKYYEYLNYFGIGEKTGVDISSESSGIVMPKEQVRRVDLARIGFGHAVAVTQLQMANVYAKITTGNDLTPNLLNKISIDDKILYNNVSSNSKVKLNKETINTINSMLSNNINNEDSLTFVPGYNVGGKTGTAQKYDENGQIATGKYISSFIGTYPADNPKYVLIVCVNEPRAGAYYGGVVAKPIGQRIFSEIFEIKSIEPTDSEQKQIQPTIEMPNLSNKTIADACSELKTIGLNVLCDGEGEFVINQQPSAGTKLYFGEVVYLMTN